MLKSEKFAKLEEKSRKKALKQPFKYGNPWERIPPEEIQAESFTTVIEIPKGGKQKYEIDERTGLLRLDRILYTSTHYPENYGFIPQTLSEDGDALDVLVLCTEALQPLCTVNCYPIGVITMIDQDLEDDKIIAIPFGDPQMNAWHDMSELPNHLLNEIQHFFSVYKELEGKQTSLTTSGGRAEAMDVINKAIAKFRAAHSK
ncbi:MAG: inorganic diphosphatase [Eubacteriales bacterium]|nr:inorganic diphosphatase [Eubacteriales bacterium]